MTGIDRNRELSKTGAEMKYQQCWHEKFMHSPLITFTPGNPKSEHAQTIATIAHSWISQWQFITTLAAEKTSNDRN
jgi:hypothetical protein